MSHLTPGYAIFSDGSLIKQIIVFSNPFHLGGNRFSKNSDPSFDWETGALVKMHRLNAFSRNVNTINQKKIHTHGGIY